LNLESLSSVRKGWGIYRKNFTLPYKRYPYPLTQFKNDKNQVIIEKINQVWSTDIDYIKLEKGFAYLAAVIVFSDN